MVHDLQIEGMTNAFLLYLDFFATLSNSAFETKFGSVHNGVPFQPQRSKSKYTDMNRKMLSL